MAQSQIVILGGGVAGLAAFTRLARTISADQARIILVAPHDHYHAPHRGQQFFKRRPLKCQHFSDLLPVPHSYFQRGLVSNIDLAAQHIELSSDQTLSYDELVLAPGMQSSIPSTYQTLPNVYSLYSHTDRLSLLTALDRVLENLSAWPESTATTIIVGGGLSGVETALGLSELRRSLVARGTIRAGTWHIRLFEKRSSILPSLTLPQRQRYLDQLQASQVEIQTRRTIAKQDMTAWSRVDDPRHFRLVIFAGGQHAPRFVSHNAFLTDERGRIVVDQHLRAHGHKRVWPVGDIAAIADSGTQDAAMRHGHHAARNIAQSLRGRPLSAYESVPPVFDLKRRSNWLNRGGQLISKHLSPKFSLQDQCDSCRLQDSHQVALRFFSR